MTNEEIPSKEQFETLGFCVNCDATRVVGKHGQCINCGSKSIYRNGVAFALGKAKENYEKRKQQILKHSTKYSKVVKLNDK